MDSRNSEPQLAFAEFAEAVGLKSLERAGFEMHLRLSAENFNYRTKAEWGRLLTAYRVRPQRRTNV